MASPPPPVTSSGPALKAPVSASLPHTHGGAHHDHAGHTHAPHEPHPAPKQVSLLHLGAGERLLLALSLLAGLWVLVAISFGVGR